MLMMSPFCYIVYPQRYQTDITNQAVTDTG